MEALVGLIAGLLAALLAPALGLAAAAVAIAVDIAVGLLSLLGYAASNRRDRPSAEHAANERAEPEPLGRTNTPNTAPVAKVSRPVPRWLKRTAGAVTVVALLAVAAVWALNRFYFEETVRYALSAVESRAGITTKCDAINGSLLTGDLHLNGCRLQRERHPSSTFALSLAEASVDVDMLSLFGRAHFDSINIAGVSGWLQRSATDPDTSKAPRSKPRRGFTARVISIRDVELAMVGSNKDGNPFDVAMRIDSLVSEPFRSRMALFDLLLRSNARGSLAGAPFAITTTEQGIGRTTRWLATDVPVAELGAMTGGALAWFSAGTVTVDVDDQWRYKEEEGEVTLWAGQDVEVVTPGPLDIFMDWNLKFSGVEITPPVGTGMRARLTSKPLRALVNRFGGELPLNFRLVMNENQFEFQQSLAATGLWTAVSEGIGLWLKTKGVELTPLSEETKGKLKQGATSLLDRLRKPDQEPSSDQEQP
ncbi:MAG: hypothetical protein AAGH76_16610 [Pseudomonadota bacterium]